MVAAAAPALRMVKVRGAGALPPHGLAGKLIAPKLWVITPTLPWPLRANEVALSPQTAPETVSCEVAVAAFAVEVGVNPVVIRVALAPADTLTGAVGDTMVNTP